MPLRDNPEWSGPPSSESWEDWLERGKNQTGIEQALGEILSSDPDSIVRSTAALALGFVGGHDSAGVLTARLAQDVPLVQMEAAAALGRIGAPEAAGPLCKALKNPDRNVRANACMALGQIGDASAMACLNEALQDPDPFVRNAARMALGSTPGPDQPADLTSPERSGTRK
jgi:HEAT repeat protein